MTRYQDVGHCKRCHFQWVIGDATRYRRRRASGSGPHERRSIQCPVCRGGDIRIDKEKIE